MKEATAKNKTGATGTGKSPEPWELELEKENKRREKARRLYRKILRGKFTDKELQAALEYHRERALESGWSYMMEDDTAQWLPPVIKKHGEIIDKAILVILGYADKGNFDGEFCLRYNDPVIFKEEADEIVKEINATATKEEKEQYTLCLRAYKAVIYTREYEKGLAYEYREAAQIAARAAKEFYLFEQFSGLINVDKVFTGNEEDTISELDEAGKDEATESALISEKTKELIKKTMEEKFDLDSFARLDTVLTAAKEANKKLSLLKGYLEAVKDFLKRNGAEYLLPMFIRDECGDVAKGKYLDERTGDLKKYLDTYEAAETSRDTYDYTGRVLNNVLKMFYK